MPWQTKSNRVVPPDWHRRKTACWRTHGDLCHVCGHRGADEIDHILAVAHGGTHEPGNLAPIHGGACPTCGKRCHIDKTTTEAHARRVSRKRPPERHPGLR